MTLAGDIRERLRARAGASPPREPARLPAGRYADRAFHEAERALFARSWLLAGRLDEVARPGLYMTWEKTRVPLIVVHAVDGVVRCFYNSCRHRGAPVVRVPRGRNRALRCQYHSWTYDTSGRLVSVPDERDFVDLRREERGLVPVACALAGGGIFVNEDADAPDLRDWLGPAGEELRAAVVGEWRTLDQRSVTVAANWKRVMERLLAGPPVPPRAGVDLLVADGNAADVETLPNGHLRVVAPFTPESARALGLASPLDWTDPADEDAAGLGAMLHSTAAAWVLFPNLLIMPAQGGVLSLAVWPDGVASTLLDAVWYAPDWDEGDSPAEQPAWQARLDWTRGLLDGAVAAFAGDAESVAALAERGDALESGSEAARRWHEALDERLGGDAPAAPRVR